MRGFDPFAISNRPLSFGGYDATSETHGGDAAGESVHQGFGRARQMGGSERLHGRLVRRRRCARCIDDNGSACASRENAAPRRGGNTGVHAHARGTRGNRERNRPAVARPLRDGPRFVEPDDDGRLARLAPRQARYPGQRDGHHGAVDVEGRKIRVRSRDDVEPRLSPVPDGESAADLHRGAALRT